jgi:hypothetical protein
MHVSEAMEFIESVLQGCIGRVFGHDKSDDLPKIKPYLDTIADFITDTDGYWVKEKALDIVHFLEEAENHINMERYDPATVPAFIDKILRLARGRTEGRIKSFQLPDNPNRMQWFLPVPRLPKQKSLGKPDK